LNTLNNHDKFSSEQINSFSRRLYFIVHGIPLKCAEKLNRQTHFSPYSRNDIRNFEIVTPDL